MTDDDRPGTPSDDELDPRESARLRRRDHDADAHRRDLMRPGMGKVFKQITDSWERETQAPGLRRRHGRRHDGRS